MNFNVNCPPWDPHKCVWELARDVTVSVAAVQYGGMEVIGFYNNIWIQLMSSFTWSSLLYVKFESN